MKRTFIAIDIPFSVAIKDCISSFSAALENEKIKWLEPDNLHLTLKFLGETKETMLQTIGDTLAIIASEQPVFDISIKGPGVFKSIVKPTVIWLGVEVNPILETLYSAINVQMEKLGFIPESRKFSPHLTIGRVKYIKEKSKLQQLLQENSTKVFQHFRAGEIVFYESILGYTGPKYIPLGKYQLNKAS
ncbi:MAG: RNA 2',3'-cyclic phosphodiesterase [Bacteroidales bacterium]|nr:RNA 2',3'-cyclic phosphodiesterase [Bacteroidales bacterium]